MHIDDIATNKITFFDVCQFKSVCRSILYHHHIMYLYFYLFAVATDVIPHYPHPPLYDVLT